MDVHLPDTTLHAHVEGTGPTLLVMHGGLGLDHTYLRPWLDPLADDLRVVYYDHRGNGRSERPESLEGVDHARGRAMPMPSGSTSARRKSSSWGTPTARSWPWSTRSATRSGSWD